MKADRMVVPLGSSEHRDLVSRGWTEVAESWGADLRVVEASMSRLEKLATPLDESILIRELDEHDIKGVLILDAKTLADYPGDVATAHDPLTRQTAQISAERRAWGAFANGALVAVTYLWPSEDVTETDFTVVDPGWRRRGIGTALKAASVLALSREGYSRFRAGGSADNPAIMSSNRAIGYAIDERWVTLVPANLA